jgi:hypothetical protein
MPLYSHITHFNFFPHNNNNNNNVNKEASHWAKLVGGNKIGNLIFGLSYFIATK